MRNNGRFQGGFAGAVYKCGCCGKMTRETGEDESSCQLCAYCYIEAGWENSLSDGNCTQEEFDTAIANLKIRYKRA
jgi:hypothetical protein